MAGGWLRCRACRRETSVTAGTIFEGTRKPLRTWFLAMWFVTSQKNGVSALGLQRALGLGSYETSWTWLHKLRRAMVRPGRDRLAGEIEADETYVGGPEEGKRGREVRARASSRWRPNSAGAASGASAFGASRTSLPRACWPSCKTPWSRGRQFILTAGVATPGCRPPVTAIRSRFDQRRARNRRTRSCHASTKSPPLRGGERGGRGSAHRRRLKRKVKAAGRGTRLRLSVASPAGPGRRRLASCGEPMHSRRSRAGIWGMSASCTCAARSYGRDVRAAAGGAQSEAGLAHGSHAGAAPVARHRQISNRPPRPDRGQRRRIPGADRAAHRGAEDLRRPAPEAASGAGVAPADRACEP